MEKDPELTTAKVGSTSSEEPPANRPAAANDGYLMDWERGLVGWESPADPENPLHFSALRRRLNLVCMGLTSTLAPMGSTMTAPALAQTLDDFNEPNQVLGAFSIVIWVLGFAVGPLFLGPLSEMFGRYPVMIGATWFMVVFILASGFSPSINALIVFRFLAGTGGSAAMTIAPAVCADMYPVERRIRSTAMITMAQCLAPTVGPLLGSFVGQYLGWRWNYWLLLIMSGLSAAFMTLVLKESYAPFLLRRKTEKMQKELGRNDLRPHMSKDISRTKMLQQAIVRPVKLLGRSVIVMSVSFYVAIVYGCLYLWFTTIPTVYQGNYGWSPSLTGLAYIGIGLGMVVGLSIIMRTNDATVVRLTKQNDGIYEPEMRLPWAMYWAALIPISLFWYGWSVEKGAHWIVPIIGSTLYGFGMLGVFVLMQQYMVDTFSMYAASAVAVNRCSISIAGATLPLAGPPLYAKLGDGLGNTVLGIITLILTPMPWIFLKYGKRIRERWPVTL